MQQKTFKVTLKAKFEIDAKSMQEAQEILNTHIGEIPNCQVNITDITKR